MKIKLGEDEYELDFLLSKLFSDFKQIVENQDALNKRINGLTNVTEKMSEVMDVLMLENNVIINEETGKVEKKNILELEKDVKIK